MDGYLKFNFDASFKDGSTKNSEGDIRGVWINYLLWPNPYCAKSEAAIQKLYLLLKNSNYIGCI